MKHHIKITFDSQEDADNAKKYIERCRQVRADGNFSTPIAGASASILLCALGRSENVKQWSTGVLAEIT